MQAGPPPTPGPNDFKNEEGTEVVASKEDTCICAVCMGIHMLTPLAALLSKLCFTNDNYECHLPPVSCVITNPQSTPRYTILLSPSAVFIPPHHQVHVATNCCIAAQLHPRLLKDFLPLAQSAPGPARALSKDLNSKQTCNSYNARKHK